MADQSQDVRMTVETLSKHAFDLAVARWQKGSALTESEQDQVRQLQTQLRQLAEQLRRDQPKLYSSVSDTLSEGLLDLKYALNAPPAISLRLHHYIESQPQAG